MTTNSNMRTAEIARIQESHQAALTRVEDHYKDQLEQLDAKIKAYEEAAEKQDKLSNLRGWAVDRAINMTKTKDTVVTFDQVKTLAEQLAHYTYGSDYAELTGDTVQ